MLTIAQKTIFFFHSLESSFDLQSNKKIGVGHQPNLPCKAMYDMDHVTKFVLIYIPEILLYNNLRPRE